MTSLSKTSLLLLLLLTGCTSLNFREAIVDKAGFTDLGEAYRIIGEWNNEFNEDGYNDCSLYTTKTQIKIVCYDDQK